MPNNGRCPRLHCGGALLREADGRAFCLLCSREPEGTNGTNDSYSETLAMMGASPSLTAQTTLERYEDSQAEGKHNWALLLAVKRRNERLCIQDTAFAEDVAQRLGVTLEDLRLSSKRPDDQARLTEAITELHTLGLSSLRIAAVLGRHESGIRQRLVRLKAENYHI